MAGASTSITTHVPVVFMRNARNFAASKRALVFGFLRGALERMINIYVHVSFYTYIYIRIFKSLNTQNVQVDQTWFLVEGDFFLRLGQAAVGALLR